ncbi:hypothetical protein AGMMS49944_05360 [Spirochaetia bacterium]|nr:hypothetical protein AGMMS49944_05360 [Spirochaetia bacterium]
MATDLTSGQKVAYRSLMAAIISRALDDLRGRVLLSGISDVAKDEAMAFFYSPDCEAYALVLGLDPQELRDKAAGLYRVLIHGKKSGSSISKKALRSSPGLIL